MCSSCGAAARADDRFCGRCGTELVAAPPPPPEGEGFCTSCSAPVERDDRFCGRCGAPVREVVAEPEAIEAEDLLADWDLEVPEDEEVPLPSAAEQPPHRDDAITEAIPRPPRPSDTAVIARYPEVVPSPPLPSLMAPGPAPESRAPSRGFPLGATVALLGAVAVIVSAILEWNGPFGPPLPRDIAARLLFDPTGPTTGPNLGVVVLVVGTIGALMAILTMAVPALRLLRRLLGLAALAIPAGFAVRTVQLALGEGTLLDLPDLLGPGVYVAAAGAFVEMVAGKWFGR
jgi:Double zinc ribbon